MCCNRPQQRADDTNPFLSPRAGSREKEFNRRLRKSSIFVGVVCFVCAGFLHGFLPEGGWPEADQSLPDLSAFESVVATVFFLETSVRRYAPKNNLLIGFVNVLTALMWSVTLTTIVEITRNAIRRNNSTAKRFR